MTRPSSKKEELFNDIFHFALADAPHHAWKSYEEAIRLELTKALKELREEANLIETNDKWGGSNVEPKRAVTVDIIDQKIKELGGE